MRGLLRRISAVGQARGALRLGLRGPGLGEKDRPGTRRNHPSSAFLTRSVLSLALLALLVPALSALAAPTVISLPKDTLYDLTSDSEGKKTQEIIDAVRKANARLENFGIVREGDDLTLNFLVWTDNAKVPFHMAGNKHDFYRMAMGVSLEDTARALVEADSTINFLKASKTKESIVIEVESKKAAVKPPPPPPPSEDVNAIFIEAVASRDPAKLKAFLEKYPDSPRAGKVREILESGKEDEVYKATLAADTLAAYEKFLAAYPRSARRADVEQRIAELKREDDARREKARAAEAAKKKAEADAASAREAEARSRDAARRAQEEQAFAKAKKAGTAEAMKAFLDKYPRSSLSDDAEGLLAVYRDDEAFSRSKNSAKGLSDYLAAYPKGRHAAEAKELIEKAEADEMRARSSAIRAVAVTAAPKVDGKSDDAAWKKAPLSRISLKSESRGPRIDAVDIRAVHMDGIIYILAQWRDRAADVEYRPWEWNEEKKKYGQSSKLDDAFAISIYKNGAPGDACMLQGSGIDADIWLWRAFWSELSGLASDQRMVASRDRLPKSNPFMDKSGRGQMWLQNLTDQGRTGWGFDVPLPSRTQAKVVPSYIAVKASGSAADVSARGTWANGLWTVEFARAFDTGNDDDAPLSARKDAVVSFAAYDHSDKDDHATSGLIKLDIEGK